MATWGAFVAAPTVPVKGQGEWGVGEWGVEGMDGLSAATPIPYSPLPIRYWPGFAGAASTIACASAQSLAICALSASMESNLASPRM